MHIHVRRCAKVKRQRERGKAKHMRMEIQPQRGITVELRGYQAEELGRAVDSMARSQAFATAIDMPGHKKKAITHKGHYSDNY
jgi:hypothetical protein